MFRAVLLFAFPCLIASAVINDLTGNEIRTGRVEEPAKWKIASKFIDECIVGKEYSAMANCVGVKAVAVLDRASRMSTISILPGISFIADSEELQRNGRALSEEDIENSISDDPSEKSSKLVDMLFDSVSRFLQTHTLQFRVPKTASSEIQRALDEGRAKIKKKLLPFLGILAVKIFALLPLLLGGVGFLALKALLIGKIALIIAGILALQKYSSAGSFGGFGKLTDPLGSSGSSYSPAGYSSPGGYYRRSIEDQAAAQHLAYSAQIPQETVNSS